jgi:hypothetical protein
MDEKEILSTIAEEATKGTIGKIIDGVGTFLGKICMPAAEEFGLYLRDKVHYYRLSNLEKIVCKTQMAINDKPIVNQVTPKSLYDFIEKSSWSDDDGIQNMWAGLLVGELTNISQSDSNLPYYSLLAELSPYQARLVNLLYGDDRICSSVEDVGADDFDNELNLKEKLTFPIKKILEISPRPLDYIVQGHSHEDVLADQKDHWLAIKYLYPNITHLRRIGVIKSFTLSTKENTMTFDPTYIGLDFYMNCTGIRLYPLEAYIVTRRYWKGINENKSNT